MKPIEHVLGVLRITSGPTEKGEYTGFCPAHDDRNTPNLHVREAENGAVLVHCFAGCHQERVLAALIERGVARVELFARRNGERGAPIPSNYAATPQRSPADRHCNTAKALIDNEAAPNPITTSAGCTLEAYAQHKRLPVGFLRDLGLKTVHYIDGKAVKMPYLDARGSEEVCVRFRVALEGQPKIKTRKGDKHRLYGLWRLDEARKAGYVILVEGESDCHVLWYHGFPALGVPGAGNWRDEWYVEMEGIRRVCAVVEPDQGGEVLWRSLAASPLRERLYRLELEVPDDQD